MIALIVEFRIKQDHIAAFDSALAQNARLSRETEPGCTQFDVCRDAAEPALRTARSGSARGPYFPKAGLPVRPL